MKDIVKDIEKFSDDIIPNSTFRLKERGFGLYKIDGNNMSDAINVFKNRREPIKVLNWFKDFWIYLEVRFMKVDNDYKNLKKEKRINVEEQLSKHFLNIEDDFYKTFISLSIFQGESSDDIKNQLFRAEWDTHEDNFSHPQPHWHIYPLKYGHKKYEDFEVYMDMYKEDGFENTLKDSNEELIDISLFHFAMAGNLSLDEKSYIHPINESYVIPNWIPGLLSHIKQQLEYVKQQRNANRP